MADKRPPAIKVTTPEGTFIWPKLNEPDFKFSPDKGQFQCRIRLTQEEAQPIIDKIDAAAKVAYDDAVAKLEAAIEEAKTGADKKKLKDRLVKFEMASKPYTDDVDDDGDANGNIILNFKMPHKVSWKDKAGKEVTKLLYPAIFDAAGKLMKSPPAIWGGTKGALAGEIRPFAAPLMAGASLRLTGAQVIELSSGGGDQDAASMGFGKREGGYEADEEALTAKAAKPAAAADDSGEEASGESDDF
jgi:hypothetical protein